MDGVGVLTADVPCGSGRTFLPSVVSSVRATSGEVLSPVLGFQENKGN